MFNRWFYILFIVVSIIGVLHQLGFSSAYYTLWWFDIVLHFLGGFWIGGMALWFFSRMNPVSSPTYLHIDKFFKRLTTNGMNVYAIGLITALFVGIGWEFLEIFIDPLMSSEMGYIEDTIMDLFMDSAGGLTAAFLFSRFFQET